MSKKTFGSFIVLSVIFLLLGGIMHASKSRYEEQRKAILEQCATEQKRLGLTDRKTVFAKYPTPEITLCRIARIVPGGTAEVVTKGKFAPGTKFLFDNDNVEVVKEAVTASEYRASIRVPKGLGPGIADLEAFAPVSAGHARCRALYIGGRYEWDFTADNGWKIRLKMVDEGFNGKGEPEPVYRIEFYRGTEAKPFEVRDLKMGIWSVQRGSYQGSISESAADSASLEAEMERLSQKVMDMTLSQKERDKIAKRLNELMAKMMQEAEKAADPKYWQEMEKKKQEFGCYAISFWLKPDGTVEGNMSCGEKVGRQGQLILKGAMKYLGPK